MKKPMVKTGTCKTCGINCWASQGGKPSIWPCGIETCPYPRGQVVLFPTSSTGSSLLQIAGN